MTLIEAIKVVIFLIIIFSLMMYGIIKLLRSVTRGAECNKCKNHPDLCLCEKKLK